MGNKSVENELLELETQYWQAVKAKDFEKALGLTDDPCIVVGPKGIANIDREKFRAMMRSATHTLRNFDLKDPQARTPADGVGVLAYTVHSEWEVDGKPVTLESAHSSTWIKRNGRWVCALHTESLPGDSFGRDRKAA